MRIFNLANFSQEVTLFIHSWIEFLSKNEFQEACAQLDVPERNKNSITWSDDKLREVFLDYCWHERMPLINSPYAMDLQKEKIDFYEYYDGTGYAVEYDIPLDGEWSDLTAQFSFVKNAGNVYYVFLKDIHVL